MSLVKNKLFKGLWGRGQKENVHLCQMMRSHAEAEVYSEGFHSLPYSILKNKCCSKILNSISLGG